MANKKPGRTFIILILGALMTVTPFSIDLYLPAFGEIADDFNTTPSKIALSITSYFIGFAIGQLLYGPLLDRYGRKPPLYAGLIIYIITCIACLLAPTLEILVGVRLLQALGGCVAGVAAIAMVRDFFPVEESAKILSLLILILGVSPLLAPTVGGFISTWLGWHWIFIILAIIAFLILLLIFFFLPEGHQPDASVSLKVKPMLATFMSILKTPQFYTYTLAGAFSFATLFIYVAGSPVIFMELFRVSPRVYGGLFALLSVGFIGSNQLNILFLRRYKSEQIFRVAMFCHVAVNALFFLGAWNGWYGLEMTILMFFLSLSCLGFIYPNATALALTPFTDNMGSASALLGFLQIGVAGLVSGGVGFFGTKSMAPFVALMVITSVVALVILMMGLKKSVMLSRKATEVTKN